MSTTYKKYYDLLEKTKEEELEELDQDYTESSEAAKKRREQAVQSANVSFERGKATYGMLAEQLAQGGMSGAGYSDNLTRDAYATRQQGIASANTTYSDAMKTIEGDYSKAKTEIGRNYNEKLLELNEMESEANKNRYNAYSSLYEYYSMLPNDQKAKREAVIGAAVAGDLTYEQTNNLLDLNGRGTISPDDYNTAFGIKSEENTDSNVGGSTETLPPVITKPENDNDQNYTAGGSSDSFTNFLKEWNTLSQDTIASVVKKWETVDPSQQDAKKAELSEWVKTKASDIVKKALSSDEESANYSMLLENLNDDAKTALNAEMDKQAPPVYVIDTGTNTDFGGTEGEAFKVDFAGNEYRVRATDKVKDAGVNRKAKNVDAGAVFACGGKLYIKHENGVFGVTARGSGKKYVELVDELKEYDIDKETSGEQGFKPSTIMEASGIDEAEDGENFNLWIDNMKFKVRSKGTVTFDQDFEYGDNTLEKKGQKAAKGEVFEHNGSYYFKWKDDTLVELDRRSRWAAPWYLDFGGSRFDRLKQYVKGGEVPERYKTTRLTDTYHNLTAGLRGVADTASGYVQNIGNTVKNTYQDLTARLQGPKQNAALSYGEFKRRFGL